MLISTQPVDMFVSNLLVTFYSVDLKGFFSVVRYVFTIGGFSYLFT